ncbi:MAG: type II toxin-antitoxin system HicA family toxin [Actinobacteria bacterium]|nr:type II toxin-antitoxin system HicA family toxin [Actinomycetota bacterium]
MSTPLPQVSGHAVVSALSRAGFAQVSQRGSHVKPRSEAGLTVIVPMHRELAPGQVTIARRARESRCVPGWRLRAW